MRDYAKKSFVLKSPQLSAELSQGSKNHSLNPDTRNTSFKKYWVFVGAVLIIIIGAALTAENFYKHFHSEKMQTQKGAPIKTIPVPNTPSQPVFDFYNRLPNQTISQPVQTTQTTQTTQTAQTAQTAQITQVTQSTKITQAAPITTITPTSRTIPDTNTANTNTANTNTANTNTANTNTANTKLMTPAPISNISASPAAAPILSANSEYIIQVGAYRNKDQARSMQARLLLLGLHPNLTYSADSAWYRVDLGPFSSETMAKNVRHKLQNAEIEGAEIKPSN